MENRQPTATAWMVRNDGKPFAVDHHTYADPEDPEDILRASEWIYQNTASQTVQARIVQMMLLWARTLRRERPAYEVLLEYARDNEGFFPSQDFIHQIQDRLHAMEEREPRRKKMMPEEEIRDWFHDLAERLLWQLSQEFLRVRYGGMYDTEKGCKDMIFRISSVGFDWYPVICRMVRTTPLEVETVTIVRDAESTGMGNARYFTADGKARYDRMPKEDFLAEACSGNGSKNHLFVLEGTEDPGRRTCLAGLYEGRSVYEIHGLTVGFLESLMERENRLVAEGRCDRRDL